MTIPAIFLGLLIASLYGAAFHLWRGGTGKKLLLYCILSVLGFWTGHLLAFLTGWSFARLGPIHLGFATLGSFIFLKKPEGYAADF